jgi:hypothetical protein
MNETAAPADVVQLAQNIARSLGWAVFPCRDDKIPAHP